MRNFANFELKMQHLLDHLYDYMKIIDIQIILKMQKILK